MTTMYAIKDQNNKFLAHRDPHNATDDFIWVDESDPRISTFYLKDIATDLAKRFNGVTVVTI